MERASLVDGNLCRSISLSGSVLTVAECCSGAVACSGTVACKGAAVQWFSVTVLFLNSSCFVRFRYCVAGVRAGARMCPQGVAQDGGGAYRGTLLMRNTPILGPYSRAIPRVLWWS